MAFTNSTPNYGLPQWLATDKPAFETDMNNAYLTIDNSLKSNETSATSAEAKANGAVTTANQANSTAQSAVTAAQNAQSSADMAKKAADDAQTTANQAQASADSKAPIANSFQQINIATLGTTVSLTFITTGTNLYRFVADVATPQGAVFSVNGTITPAFDVAGNAIGAGYYAQGATVLCTVTDGKLFILSGGGSGGGGSQIDYSACEFRQINTIPSGLPVQYYELLISYYYNLQFLTFKLSMTTTAQIPVSSTIIDFSTIPQFANLTNNFDFGAVLFESPYSTGNTTGPTTITRKGAIVQNNVFIKTQSNVVAQYSSNIASWFN